MKSFLKPLNKYFSLSVLIMVFILNNCSEEINYFPETLGNFEQVDVIRGEQAQMFVNRLHFNSVTDEKNEIAFYGQGKPSITIYITFYDSDEKAFNNFKKMTRKISPENSVFIQGSYFEMDGIKIYRCFGMGQTHFVFSYQMNLFWLSVPTRGNEKILQEYLNLIM